MYLLGKTESFEDQLRSILAQFHFSYEIQQFEASGVPFRTYMYVPEQHPVTKSTFYEREDEAHLIKVIDTFKCNMYTCMDGKYSVWQVTQEMEDHLS